MHQWRGTKTRPKSHLMSLVTSSFPDTAPRLPVSSGSRKTVILMLISVTATTRQEALGSTGFTTAGLTRSPSMATISMPQAHAPPTTTSNDTHASRDGISTEPQTSHLHLTESRSPVPMTEPARLGQSPTLSSLIAECSSHQSVAEISQATFEQPGASSNTTPRVKSSTFERPLH